MDWRSLACYQIFWLYFRVAEPQLTNVIYGCNFDNGLCPRFTQSSQDKFDWEVGPSSKPTSNRYPVSDHGGSGKYMYIESSVHAYDNAKLELSIPGGVSSHYCLTFYYHLSGRGYPGTLNVYNGSTKIFVADDSQSINWLQESKTISLGSFGVVTFEGKSGGGYDGAIALDDVSISYGECQLCGAPSRSGTFGWLNLTQLDDDILDCKWDIKSASVSNAVAVFKIRRLNWGSSVKFFDGSGSEMYHETLGRTTYLEIPFGEAENISVEGSTRRQWNTISIQYIILKQDLDAAPSVDGWRVEHSYSTETLIAIQWRNISAELNNTVRHYLVLIKTNNGTSLTAGEIVPSTKLTMEFSSLKVFTEYVVNVYAIDDTGQPYKSMEMVAWTDQGVPSEAPHVNISNISLDSMSVSWSPIPKQYHHGILLGYRVTYGTTCWHGDRIDVNFGIANTSTLLRNLLPGTEYRIDVAGFTSKGLGNKDIRRATTRCAGQLYFKARQGRFVSPNYPCSGFWRQRCHLSFTLAPENYTKAIWIRFYKFDVGSKTSEATCRDESWVRVQSSHNSSLGPADLLMCGRNRYFALLLPGDQVNVTFSRLYRSEFSASYRAIDKPLTAIRLTSWNISVSRITKSTMDITWSDFPLNVPIYRYFAKYKASYESEDGILKFKGENVHSPEGKIYLGWLEPYTVYEIRVLALTGSIDNTTYSSNTLSVITGEDVPIKAPFNVRVTNLLETMVNVQWERLPLKYARGRLLRYNVYYKELLSGSHTKTYVKTVNASENHTVLEGLKQGLQYQIQVSALNSEGEGPLSALVYTTTSCGVTFKQLFGRLKLSQSLRCLWRIDDVNISQAVALVSIKTMPHIDCYRGYFKILSGNGSEVFYYPNCRSQTKVPSLLEIPFGNAKNLTMEASFSGYGWGSSRAELQYAIMNTGLKSAQVVPEWNITVVNSTATVVSLEWGNLTKKIEQNVGYYMVFVTSANDSSIATEFISPQMLTFDMEKLVPFTVYKVELFGVDLFGQIYKSLEVITMTDESVPFHAPILVRNPQDGFYYVNFSWLPIPKRYRYGILLGYRIVYNHTCSAYVPSGELNVTASSSSVLLTELIPGTTYEVKIAGFTSKGMGIWNSQIMFSTCHSYRILTARSGTVQSPYFRCNYNPRNPCHLNTTLIPRNLTKAIWIQFNAFYMDDWSPRYPYCRGDANLSVITKASTASREETVLCGRKRSFAMYVPTSRVELIFGTKKYNYHNEFNASYVALEQPLSVELVPSWKITLEVTLSFPHTSSITVKWPSFPLQVTVQEFWVAAKEENKEMIIMFPAGLGTSLILKDFVKAYTPYQINILALSGSIANRTYSSEPKTVRHEESVPSAAPPNVRAKNVQPGVVLVQWDPLPLHHGRLRGYKVYYCVRGWSSYEPWPNLNTSGQLDQMQKALTGLRQGMRYQIYVRAFTSKGEGPRSETLEIVTDCGVSLNQSFGEVVFGQISERSVACSWTIQSAGIKGAVALIYLQKVYLRNCEEFVEVFDGKGNNMVNRHGCQPPASGSFLEVPFFEASEVSGLILKYGEDVNIQFAILRRSLDSAILSAWNINGYNTSEKSLVVDWSDLDANLRDRTSFFVVVLNRTRPRIHGFGALPTISLHFFNSTELSASFTDLPIFSRHRVHVYRVEIDGTVYKSGEVIIETEESVPSRQAVITNLTTDPFNNSITLGWSPLAPEYTHGILRGYKIEYQGQTEKHSIVTNATMTQVTLANLTNGITYYITVAGFTRRGSGPLTWTYIALCGGDLSHDSGFFQNRDNPSPSQLHCRWQIRRPAKLQLVWITFFNYSFGRRNDLRQCRSGGVKLFTLSSANIEEREEVEICPQKATLNVLVQSEFIEVTARVYHSFSANYEAKTENVSGLTGKELKTWKAHQSHATTSSFTIQWHHPPQSFLSNSSVERYLLLYTSNKTTFYFAQWLQSNATTLTVSDLQPLTEYKINLVAFLADGHSTGSTGWTLVKTDEGVPAGGPSIYRCTALGYSQISLSWFQIYQGYLKEVSTLKGYRIYVSKSGEDVKSSFRNITVGPNQQTLNVTGLKADTSYHIWIAGFSSKGQGAYSKCLRRTMCGGAVFNASGHLQNPQDWRSKICLWRINPPIPSRSVLFSFEQFHFSSCYFSYITVSNRVGHSPERLQCGSKSPFLVLTKGGQVNFEYHADHWFISLFKASFFSSNESIENVRPLLNWHTTVTSRDTKTFNVSWTHYHPGSGNTLYAYAVLCFPTESTGSDVVIRYANKTRTALQVQDLQINTGYRVQVVALLLDTSSGALTFQGSLVVVTSTTEGVPTEGPRIDSYEHLNYDTIRIRWSKISPEYTFGVLRGYRIFYGPRPYDCDFSSSKNTTVPPYQLECNITGLSAYTYYCFKVAGFTSMGDGPPGYHLVARTRCGGNVYNTSGYIHNPSYPDGVTYSTDCLWRIHSTKNNGSIILNFDHFSVPLSTRCSDVYVTVRDANGNSTERLCGFRRPFTVTRQGSYVDVHFYSKRRFPFFWRGFKALYLNPDGNVSVTVSPTPHLPLTSGIESSKTTQATTRPPLTTATRTKANPAIVTKHPLTTGAKKLNTTSQTATEFLHKTISYSNAMTPNSTVLLFASLATERTSSTTYKNHSSPIPTTVMSSNASSSSTSVFPESSGHTKTAANPSTAVLSTTMTLHPQVTVAGLTTASSPVAIKATQTKVLAISSTLAITTTISTESNTVGLDDNTALLRTTSFAESSTVGLDNTALSRATESNTVGLDNTALSRATAFHSNAVTPNSPVLQLTSALELVSGTASISATPQITAKTPSTSSMTENSTSPPVTESDESTTPSTPELKEPKTPSVEETRQSAEAVVLDISQWDKATENKFKVAIANGASTYCANPKHACQKNQASSLQERSLGEMIFRPKNVHLLPGYPVQPSRGPLRASIAFYLQVPDGMRNDNLVISKSVLLSIAHSAQPEIEKSIGSTISDVRVLIEDSPSIELTNATSDYETERDDLGASHGVIIRCVVEVILVIVIAAVVV